MRTHLLVISLVLGAHLSVSSNGAAGQQPKKEEPRPAAKAPTDPPGDITAEVQRARLKQRVIELIRDAGDSAARLDDRRSTARIQAAAAEALWPDDRVTARNLFRSAFEAALTCYREDRETLPDPLLILTRQSNLDLCEAIIGRIGARDAALAQQLTEALNEQKRKARDTAGGRSRQPYLARDRGLVLSNQMTQVRSLLRRDQQAAIREAQRIFAKGALSGLETMFFLSELSRQDRAAADHLFIWLLASICYDEYAAPEELVVLVQYIFPSQFLWMPGGTPKDPLKWPRDPSSEDLMLQWYIEASLITLSRVASSDLSVFEDASEHLRWACYLAIWLEPRVAQARPQLVTTWQSLINQLQRRLTPQQQVDVAGMPERAKESESNWRLLAQPLDPVAIVQQTIARAEKATRPADRDQLFQLAALDADRIPDLSWALEIALKISDKEFRQQVEDWLHFNAGTRALKENELAEARRYALAIKTPDQCVDLFSSLARLALTQKDKAGASDLLTEAESQATKADDSPAKVRALVIVGNLWVGLDLPQGLQTLASAVETANRVPEYSREQDRTIQSLGSGTGRRYAFNRGNPSVDLGRSLAGLAAVDFEGALDLTRSIKDAPLRASTSITVGASVLERIRKESPQPQKVTNPKP